MYFKRVVFRSKFWVVSCYSNVFVSFLVNTPNWVRGDNFSGVRELEGVAGELFSFLLCSLNLSSLKLLATTTASTMSLFRFSTEPNWQFNCWTDDWIDGSSYCSPSLYAFGATLLYSWVFYLFYIYDLVRFIFFSLLGLFSISTSFLELLSSIMTAMLGFDTI